MIPKNKPNSIAMPTLSTVHERAEGVCKVTCVKDLKKKPDITWTYFWQSIDSKPHPDAMTWTWQTDWLERHRHWFAWRKPCFVITSAPPAATVPCLGGSGFNNYYSKHTRKDCTGKGNIFWAFILAPPSLFPSALCVVTLSLQALFLAPAVKLLNMLF